jgi:ankyrin repeat protein
VNCQDALGNTALHYAVHGGSSRVVEYLLYERHALQLPNVDGRSPLHVALSRDKDTKIGEHAFM